MKIIKVLIGILFFTFISCENNSKNELINSSFNARIIGKGLDCGNTYLIQFYDNVEGMPPNSFDNIFYAINLPPILQVNDLEVNVNFRTPNDNELMACTTMGITYPQIIIEN
jgi:hypothetical protein